VTVRLAVAVLAATLAGCASSPKPEPCPPPPAPVSTEARAWAGLTSIAFAARATAGVCDAVIESLAARGDKDSALAVLEACQEGLQATNTGIMAAKEALDAKEPKDAACALPGALAGLRGLCRRFASVKVDCPAPVAWATEYVRDLGCKP
jgi:hypothetical protein